METQGEKYRRLRDFLQGSFLPSELKIFLKLNGYEEVAAAVPMNTTESEYFFDIVQALDHRGLVDLTFFACLTQERPSPEKEAQIKRLEEVWLVSVVESIGMKLKLIPAGEFQMGSTERENEGPSHLVTISRPFFLGVNPVTQGEYLRVILQNRSHFTGNDRRPVENVSWFDAVEFCNALSEKEGLPPFYAIKGQAVEVPDWNGPGYRLPTEAEWEYACRAKNLTRFSFGDDETALGQYAWYSANSTSQTHAVEEKDPNNFGLHDMHGNVWEWCWDGYDPDYYTQSPAEDPQGPEAAARRVIRGGSWHSDPQDARSARRDGNKPGNSDYRKGFRLARE